MISTTCAKHGHNYLRRLPDGICSSMPKGKFPSLKDDVDRFFSKVEKTDSCWIWRGNMFPFGYGLFPSRIGGYKNHPAHRWCWEYYNGKIPKGMQANHKCDNRACVNPDHIYIGSQKQNMADMISRGRAAHKERHPMAKITMETARAIRMLFFSGGIPKQIAKKYGISRSHVFKVANGGCWREDES